MTMFRAWSVLPLWQRVLAGLVLGILLGAFFPAAAPWISLIGELFLRLIRLLVVPVLLVVIAAGITELGDPKRLGTVGGRAIGLFAALMVIGVANGMVVGLMLRPGANNPLGHHLPPHDLGAAKSLAQQALDIVPPNIFEAMAASNMLALILFSGLIGVGALLSGDAGKPLAAFLQSASAALLKVVSLVMELTPFGVFALVANAVAANGVAVIANVQWLALGTLLCVILQIVIVHATMLALIARRSVVTFYGGIADALMIAFSTASSTATMPVALRCAVENLDIPRPVASTVLPLGASIGKDGTAAYVGLISIFSLQALGIEPTAANLMVILVAGSLAAFGTAPVPSASLFMLTAVLSTIGVDTAQTALVVGFILPFDRLLDMTRTVASASANLTVTATVAKLERKHEGPTLLEPDIA